MTNAPARKGITIVLAALLALGAFTALALGAKGGKKLKTASTTEEIASSDTGAAIAQCKGNKKALSGGYRSELDLNDLAEIIIPYTSRRDTKKAWEVEALNLGDSGELTTEAYCRKANKIKAKTASEEVPSGGEATLTANCSKKQKALSGGFENPDFQITAPSRAVLTSESRKAGGRKWTVVGQSIGSDPSEYHAQVVCHKGKGLKTKSESLTLDDTATEPEQGSVVAKCKKSQRVISGGFAMDEPVIEPGMGGIAFVHASHKEGKRSWRISAVADTGREVTFDAFAYCEKKKKK